MLVTSSGLKIPTVTTTVATLITTSSKGSTFTTSLRIALKSYSHHLLADGNNQSLFKSRSVATHLPSWPSLLEADQSSLLVSTVCWHPRLQGHLPAAARLQNRPSHRRRGDHPPGRHNQSGSDSIRNTSAMSSTTPHRVTTLPNQQRNDRRPTEYARRQQWWKAGSNMTTRNRTVTRQGALRRKCTYGQTQLVVIAR